MMNSSARNRLYGSQELYTISRGNQRQDLIFDTKEDRKVASASCYSEGCSLKLFVQSD